MSASMIRCTCGSIYDSSKFKKCPECGEKPPQEEQSQEASAQPQTPKLTPEKPSEPIVSSRLKWKALLFAGVLLLGAFVYVKVSHFKAPKKAIAKKEAPRVAPKQKQSKPPSTPSNQKNSYKKLYDNNYLHNQNSFRRDNGILPPTQSSNQQNYPSGYVDPALVSKWKMKIPNTNQTWTLEIKKNGKMTFNAKGLGAPPAYSGKFEAQSGMWRIYDTTNGWADGGNYRIERNGDFYMVGRLGPGVWKKAGWF